MTTWNVNWKAGWQYPLKLSMSALWPSNLTPKYISNRFLHRRMNKLQCFCSKEYYIEMKMKKTIATCNSMNELYRNNLEHKEPDKKILPYDVIYIKFKDRQN